MNEHLIGIQASKSIPINNLYELGLQETSKIINQTITAKDGSATFVGYNVQGTFYWRVTCDDVALSALALRGATVCLDYK